MNKFEEEFPSLKNKLLKTKDMESANYENYNGNENSFYWLNKEDVETYCLDKQKVKEAIQKIKDGYDFGKIKDVDEALIRLHKELKL